MRRPFRRSYLLLLLPSSLPLLLYLLYRFSDSATEEVFYAPREPVEPIGPNQMRVPRRTDFPINRCVFLAETSGRETLNPREWCAMESAARADPNLLIIFLLAAPYLEKSQLAERILALNNTAVVRLDYKRLFGDTPLEDWYESREILRSQWSVSHMSDAVRYALLYRYGGVYLDTDVIVRKSLAGLDDGAGLESEHAIAAGVLKFAAGSSTIQRLADRFVSGYDPDTWGSNGPGVVTDVLAAGCDQHRLPLAPARCKDYTIYSTARFYPLPWLDWALLLEPSASAQLLDRMRGSYVVHTWGYFTREWPVRTGSAMDLLAREFCPVAAEYINEPGTK